VWIVWAVAVIFALSGCKTPLVGEKAAAVDQLLKPSWELSWRRLHGIGGAVLRTMPLEQNPKYLALPGHAGLCSGGLSVP